MSNDKQTTAVQWLSNQAYELFEQYSEGRFDRITLNKLMFNVAEKAEAMFRQQIENAYEQGQFDGIVMRDTDAEQYFESTFTQQQTIDEKPTPPPSQIIKEGQYPKPFR